MLGTKNKLYEGKRRKRNESRKQGSTDRANIYHITHTQQGDVRPYFIYRLLLDLSLEVKLDLVLQDY